MTDTIAHWASLIGAATMTIALIAWTVEAVALGRAGTAAALSPIATFMVLFWVFRFVDFMGWMQ